MDPINRNTLKNLDRTDYLTGTTIVPYIYSWSVELVATQTRPDIAFDGCQLSSLFNEANVCDVLRANEVVKKIKFECITLRYPRLGDLKDCSIECYSDASFGNIDNGAHRAPLFIVDN